MTASREPIRASLRAVRRLAVTQQQLAGQRPARATAERIVSTIRRLPYVQWDPVSVVAPSHLLSLRARIGSFRVSDLDRLLWKERRLLQHWIPYASLVAAEDYPIFASFMRRYPGSLSDSWGAQRAAARAFLAKHRELRARVVAELAGGPLQLSQFRDHAKTKRDDGEWAPSSVVAELLWHLLMSGEVMVVGHDRNQNLWGLADSFLPSWVDREPLSPDEAERQTALRALRGLGAATARDVHRYFIRGCYRDVDATLESLAKEGQIAPIVIDGLPVKHRHFVLAENVPLLTELETDRFVPRISVLPPFDNMVYDQNRGKRLFEFDYVREQFLPKEKRRYGMWVLPIVWGERIIGRADAQLDKEARVLRVHALFAEAGAPTDLRIGSAIRAELDDLGGFVGADSTRFTARVPSFWRAAFH